LGHVGRANAWVKAVERDLANVDRAIEHDVAVRSVDARSLRIGALWAEVLAASSPIAGLRCSAGQTAPPAVIHIAHGIHTDSIAECLIGSTSALSGAAH